MLSQNHRPLAALFRTAVPPPLGARTVAVLVAVAATVLVPGAFAQVPASPPAGVPTPLQYHSVIQGYRSYADPPVEPWRASNDRVGRIGGWRAYAREIQGGEAASDAAVPAAAAGPAPAHAPGHPPAMHPGHPMGPRP